MVLNKIKALRACLLPLSIVASHAIGMRALAETETGEEIKALIQKLGNEEFGIREDAQKQLIGRLKQSSDAVLDEIGRTQSTEVRQRCTRILMGKVARVDIGLVFRKSDRVTEIQKDIQERFKPRKDALDAKGKARDEQEFLALAKEVEEARIAGIKEVLAALQQSVDATARKEGFDVVLRWDVPSGNEEDPPVETDTRIVVPDNEKQPEPKHASDLMRAFRKNPVLFDAGLSARSKLLVPGFDLTGFAKSAEDLTDKIIDQMNKKTDERKR